MIPSSQGCYKSLLTLSAIFPCLAHSQPLSQISIATGILQQDYREFSASAPNGIFNQETGNLNTWQIQANYLPTLSISKLNLPLYLQGQYRHSNGNTQYDGYLQQGQMLIPFESTTKNNLQDIQASIGLLLTPQPVQVVPFVAYVDHTWKRGLSQYQETFSHKSLALGVSTTWQINAKWEALGLFSVGQMQCHVGELCSFDAFLKKYALTDPALQQLAMIVRGADTSRLDMTPQSAGLYALSLGLSRNFADDHEMLRHGMVMYDALYAWCRSCQGETHHWPPAM